VGATHRPHHRRLEGLHPQPRAGRQVPFTLVADVRSDGTPVAIEVQPATPVASCFATWFGTNTLPPPPTLPDTPTYPLEIDVSITP
jgi:hypothetical protein